MISLLLNLNTRPRINQNNPLSIDEKNSLISFSIIVELNIVEIDISLTLRHKAYVCRVGAFDCGFMVTGRIWGILCNFPYNGVRDSLPQINWTEISFILCIMIPNHMIPSLYSNYLGPYATSARIYAKF